MQGRASGKVRSFCLYGDTTGEIDEFGLSYESGLPSFLKWFTPNWRISWSEIQNVEKAGNIFLKHTILIL